MPAEAHAPEVKGLDRVMQLADGRRLGWREYGAPGGWPVIALHGTPGGRSKYAMADAEARRLGLRLICPDRWGYGLSDRPRDTPRLNSYADDIVDLADSLGIARFSVVGISGGGPFAAAVAALLPERVVGLALVSPVGPIAGAPCAWRLGAFHQVCFRMLPAMPGAIRLCFGVMRGVLAVSPAAAVAMASARAGSSDRATVRRPAIRQGLGETFKLGLLPGSDGAVIDMDLFGKPWSLPLGVVAAESRLWIGLEDRNVPVAAACGLAEAIPGCELSVIPDAGHFWITAHFPEVLRWLSVRAHQK